MNQLHWKQQVAERRAKLNNIRSELRVARQRYMESASDTDAGNVTRLAERERLADEALTYAEEQFTAAGNVSIAGTDAQSLGMARALIERRMAWRHKEREEQIARERQRCGRMEERHIEAHLRNTFGRFDYRECTGDAEDKAELKRIDAQLAEHQRRKHQPPSAA